MQRTDAAQGQSQLAGGWRGEISADPAGDSPSAAERVCHLISDKLVRSESGRGSDCGRSAGFRAWQQSFMWSSLPNRLCSARMFETWEPACSRGLNREQSRSRCARHGSEPCETRCSGIGTTTVAKTKAGLARGSSRKKEAKTRPQEPAEATGKQQPAFQIPRILLVSLLGGGGCGGCVYGWCQ